MKTTKRLEELLDKKDEELSELQSKLDKIEEDEEREHWRWTCHSESKNAEKLPVPRLEMRCEKVGNTWHNWTWNYALVYEHFTGGFIVVPMSQTKVGGGRNAPPIRNGVFDFPFRDGVHICHDAGKLNLPAFGLCDGKIKELSIRGDKWSWNDWKGKSVHSLQRQSSNASDNPKS